MTDEQEIEKAIAAYRRALVAAAEVASADLDEIEDHLRTLTAELRERGMPAAVAVAEAARRLGEPAEIAREHARVRTPFGGKISRGRAWSAAGLLAVLVGWFIVDLTSSSGPVLPGLVIECVLGGVLIGGLVAQLSWARPIVLGSMLCSAIDCGVVAMFGPDGLGFPPSGLLHIAIVAFLFPWRRGELSLPGIALALQVWAYGASKVAAAGAVELAWVALGATMLATIGIVLRARWSVAFSTIGAIALTGSVVQLAVAPYPVLFATVFWTAMVVIVAGGVVATTASALIQLRTTRSWLGTLEAVLR
jgi:hypothetical protein